MSAPIKMYKIKEEQINSITIQDGQLIFTTDTKKIFLDSGNNRIEYIEKPQQIYVEAIEPGNAEDGDI